MWELFAPSHGLLVYSMPNEISNEDRLEQLDILPLEMRRDKHGFFFFFKFKVDLVTANFDRLSLPRYSPRNYDAANFRPVSYFPLLEHG